MADIEVGDLIARLSFDDTGLDKSMAEINRSMKLVQSQFDKASTSLTGYGSKEDQLKTKSEALNQQMSLQQQRINKLNEAFQASARLKGADSVETEKLAVKVNNAQAKYNELDAELRTTNDLLQKTQKETAAAESSWGKLSSGLGQIKEKFHAIGAQLSEVGRTLSVGVTAPLVAIAGLSTKAAIDFESAFAGVRKTVNATEDQFQELRTGIRDMAKEIPAAATEIAKVAENAGQLGIKREAILGFTRTMVDLGVSTNLSADQASTALARLANITQMPQDQFGRLGSTIVALGNNFATTESEITEMALRLAGAGHTVGLSQAQIVSFAAALSSVGIEAEAGGSAFSRVMIDIASAIQTGNKKLIGFAATSGMTVDQFKASWSRDAAGTLVSFVEGLGKMTASGQNAFGVLDVLGLSEIRVRDALLRASGAGDLFRKSLELGTQAWAENTALTNEAEQRYKTTASQLQIFKNKLTDVGITLGDALIPALLKALDALQPLVRFVENAAKGFANLNPTMQKAVIIFASLAAAMGPVLYISGQMITSIGTIAGSIGSLTKVIAKAGGVMNIASTAVRGLGSALMFLVTNPVGIAITAIAALVAGFVILNKYMSKSSVPAVQQFGDASKSALDKASGSFQKFHSSTKSTLQETATTAKVEGGNIAKNIVDSIGKGTKKAKDTATSDMREMVAQMKTEVDRSSSTLNKLGDAIVAALKKQYEQAEKLQTSALDKQVAAEEAASKSRLKLYDKEYAEKLKLLDEDTYRQVKALQDQIDAIDNQTSAEDKANREQEQNQKVSELQKQIAAAETAEERAKLQADLTKTIADYERQLLLESRTTQKDALKSQIDVVKTTADAKKEQLKKELEDRKQAESDQLEVVRKGLEDQKTALKEHFDALTTQENLQSEARKLVVDKNNAEIIRLLSTFNPKWQDAGQSFAESFSQGLNSQKQTLAQAVKAAVDIAPAIDEQVAQLERLQKQLDALEKKASSSGGGGGAIGGIGDQAQQVADIINNETTPAVEDMGAATEDAAQTAIDAFLGLKNKATVELNGLYWSGQTVTEKTASSIADTYFAMGNQIATDLKTNHAKRLQEMQAFFANSKTLTANEKSKAIAQLTASMDAESAVVENGQNRIAEILAAAMDQKRGITEDEYLEITGIQQKMSDEGVKILAGGADQQAALLERLKNEADDLTTEQAAEVTRNSIKQRDDAVKAAQEQYTQSIAQIVRMRDETKTISADQADKLIAEAKRQRDGTVSAAEDMNYKVVYQAQAMAGAQVDKIDWTTGKILSRWTVFGNSIIKGISDTWDDAVRTTSNNWDSIKTSVSTKVSGMYDAVSDWMGKAKTSVVDTWNDCINFLKNINLKQIGANIISGMIEGISSELGNLQSKINDVGNSIGDWLKSNLKIRSPSRVTMEIGKYTGEGLAVGMEDSLSEIKRQSNAMAAAALPGINAVSMPSGSAGGYGGQSSNGGSINFDGLFNGAIFNVRSEQDAKQIAREIFTLQQQAQRGLGMA